MKMKVRFSMGHERHIELISKMSFGPISFCSGHWRFYIAAFASENEIRALK